MCHRARELLITQRLEFKFTDLKIGINVILVDFLDK